MSNQGDYAISTIWKDEAIKGENGGLDELNEYFGENNG